MKHFLYPERIWMNVKFFQGIFLCASSGAQVTEQADLSGSLI